MCNKGFNRVGMVWVMAVTLNLLTWHSEAAVYSGGAGTEVDPYRIGSVADWQTLAATAGDWDKHFFLMGDIDFGGAVLGQVGTSFTHFAGVFDGNGHVLKNGQVHPSGTGNTGVFGFLDTAGAIRNLGVKSVAVTGNFYTGGLVGVNQGRITDCYTTGTVTGEVSAEYIGGLVGQNWDGIITSCYATGAVTGGVSSRNIGGLAGYNYVGTITSCHASGRVWCGESSEYVGGLLGYNGGTVNTSYALGSVTGGSLIGGLAGSNSGGTITLCYAAGAVTGNNYVGGLTGSNSWGTVTLCFAMGAVSGNEFVGGLVGMNYGMATSCYARGSVAGVNYVGGLVGRNWYSTVASCYATGTVTGGEYVGGLVGDNEVIEVASSYWDMETSGQPTSDGGEGCTTDEMTYPYGENTYSDWDLTTVWTADVNGTINDGYPYLLGNVPPLPHPADVNRDFHLVLGEAIAYLAGWQNGSNPMAYAIRAAYLWQNGERYHYDPSEDPPVCWVLGPVGPDGEGEPPPWQNPDNPLDVNDDDLITPLDALVITNDINANGSRVLPDPPISPPPPPPYLDVNGDGAVTPVDELLVINYLNTHP